MQTIFFSLDLVGNKATLKQIRNVKETLKLYGIKTQTVIGCYNGQLETSFKVENITSVQRDVILLVAIAFKQESILIVDINGRSTLHFASTNVTESLGTLVRVSHAEAQKLQAWTYFPHTDEYFTCKGA